MKTKVDLGDRKVTIVGTAHVSEESVTEVEDTIENSDPDLVAVELDENRYQSLKDRTGWKEMNVAEALKDGKGSLLLFNLILSIYQRRIGLDLGTEPGKDMLSAVEKAEEKGIGFELIDRDINETFTRLRSELSLWQKYLLISSLFLGDGEETDVEELKQKDMLNQLVGELEEDFPAVKKVFLDERNRYMADRLLEKDFEHAVVVVGAAHVEGLAEELEGGKKEEEEEKKEGFTFPVMKALKYGFPAFILAMIGYSFYRIGFSTGFEATGFWIISNMLLAGIGAVIAKSHPATWVVSAVSSPITSLNPTLGAGMVAGYFEAKFYPPTVRELEDIAYLESYRELWGNQVGRILLTFALVSMGSALAAFISFGFILSLIS